jgi:hypothetical protein
MRRASAIDSHTTRSSGYRLCQTIPELIETTIRDTKGRRRQLNVRGLARENHKSLLAKTVVNLRRTLKVFEASA